MGCGWLLPVYGQLEGRVLATMIAIALSVIALLVWALCFAQLGKRARLGLLATVLGVGAGAWGLLEVRGVSGNFVPILGLRFFSGGGAAEAPEIAALPTPPPGAPSAWRDWPRFLGAESDARLEGVGLARDWQAQPPLEVWRRRVGPAWSGFAVAGQRALTQEQRNDEELVTCYALHTGELLWIHSEQAHFDSTIGGEGPRATPTVDAGRVYAMGATGILVCLELESGALVWRADTLADSDAGPLQWGCASSPLVSDGRVYISSGESSNNLLAYDAASGELLWAVGSGGASYASPALHEISGETQLVAIHQGPLAGYEPSSGRRLWSVEWNGRHPNNAQPVLVGEDAVLVSTGYGVGAALLRIVPGESEPELVWRSRHLKAKFANIVQREGYAYALDDGIFVCVDLASGRRKWKGGRYGHGQVILADDLLLVTGEDGELLLLEATPRERRELAQVDVLRGKTWNSPALAAPYFLMRNHKEAVCLLLPLEESTEPR